MNVNNVNIFSVPEDEDLRAMLRLVLTWDNDWFSYVDTNSGEFKRPAGSLPVETELAHDLAFNSKFEVGALHLCWQHLVKVRCDAWNNRRKSDYAEYLLERLDVIHARHSHLEVFSSISSSYCKSTLQ
jgi:hypothetical protein